MAEEKKEVAWNNYAETVAYAIQQAQGVLSKRIMRDPIISNEMMKGINNSATAYSVDEIAIMMKSPYRNEQKLMDISRYLEYAIMPYNRTLDHFTKILLYNYDMRPLTRPPSEQDQIKSYVRAKERCFDYLKKLNPKGQFQDVTKSVMLDGVKFIYVRESKDYIALQEMPIDYCKITGRTDLGFTYSFDMSFFDRYGKKYLSMYAPEFADWYDEVMKLRKEDPGKSFDTWYPMPPESAFVFKFDDTNAATIPPLAGVFGDAIQIVEYKNIMKARAILDVFAILYQKIPLDKEDHPIMGPDKAAAIASAIEAALPAGAHTVASPFEPEMFQLSKPSGDKSIIPSGVDEYWRESGVGGEQYGEQSGNAIALKYSNISDYGYVRQLYIQFERFINFFLSRISRTHKFYVQFYGNLYTNQDDIKTEKELVAQGFPAQKLSGMDGYNPWDLEYMSADEAITGIKSKMIPPSSMWQQTQSGDTGRPSQPIDDLGDSGVDMRGGGAGSGGEAL